MAREIIPQEELEKPENFSDKETQTIDFKTIEELRREEIPSERPREKTSGPLSGARGLILGTVIGLALAFGANKFLSQPEGGTDGAAEVAGNATVAESKAALTVTLAPVELARVERTMDATGSVVADELLPLLPQAAGLQIKQVLVEEGDRVSLGEVLAILDDAVSRSEIDQAEADIESANAEVEQRQAGYKRSRASLEQARAALLQAEADRDRAKSSVSQVRAARDEAIAGLKQTQAGRDDALAALKQERVGRDDALASLKQAQAGRNDALASVAQAEAQLAEAKANLAQATREFERYQTLLAEGAISAQEVDTRSTAVKTATEGVRVAEANIKSAQAKVEIADANISSAEAKVEIADARIRSAEAKVEIADANVSSARARVESATANIDTSAAELRAAEARVESARANVSSAQADIDSARSNISSAQANVRNREAKLDRETTELDQTIVRAPASGLIAERFAKIGDVTSSSKQLFSLIKNNRLELHLEVPETQLPQIEIGEQVQITSDADARIKVEGIVREIAPLIDPTTRQATVKIDLPQSDFLRPGMFLRASITTGTAQGLKIPAKAVVPQADGQSVAYVLSAEQTAKAVPIEVGEITSESSDLAQATVEVLSGLKIGDRVIVDGAGYLKDGDIVKVVSN
ncbi:MAG: efflux RND transporter periplasmic adaptor subunit [Cyanobacteriota bacterium]|nr:efflux RND transporter periplasmic adaptor subunit [Cyanobacteriota bacterium]